MKNKTTRNSEEIQERRIELAKTNGQIAAHQEHLQVITDSTVDANFGDVNKLKSDIAQLERQAKVISEEIEYLEATDGPVRMTGGQQAKAVGSIYAGLGGMLIAFGWFLDL